MIFFKKPEKVKKEKSKFLKLCSYMHRDKYVASTKAAQHLKSKWICNGHLQKKKNSNLIIDSKTTLLRSFLFYFGRK